MVERDDKYEEKYYIFKVEDMDGGGCAIAVSTGYTDYRTLNLPVDDSAKKPTVGGTTDPTKVPWKPISK